LIHSPIEDVINGEYGSRTVSIVHANFYLNRYPFSVVETDLSLPTPDPNELTYGIEDIMSVENLSASYRYGHGNSMLILGRATSPPELENYRVPSFVPQNRLYVASEEASYKYYISPNVSTSGSANTDGSGFRSSNGSFLGSPEIEYFDEKSRNECFPGNSIHIKWNTVGCVPTRYKVYLKQRTIDTNTVPAWTEVYDSFESGDPRVSTGERYGVTNITKTEGSNVARIQLAKFDKSLPAPTGQITKRKSGNRRAWESGDYMDFNVGDKVAIMRIDNSVNGVAKIKGVNKSQGWIEVYSRFNINKDIDMTNFRKEVYVINPGQVELFRQANGEWSTSPNRWSPDNNNLIDICGVRVEILGVSRRSTRAELVEICPVLAADLTDYVTEFNSVEELSDRDVSKPVGVISANTGSLSLNNSDFTFDRSNVRRKRNGVYVGSFFSRMLDDGVEIKHSYSISSLQSDQSEEIPSVPMITDSWGESSDQDGSVQVDLLDYSKVLQDRPCPDLVLKNHPVTSIVYMIMDKIGFSRVIGWPENSSAGSTEPVIKFFWCRKEESAWDAIQRLAASTQTAIFFDRYGYLRVLPLQTFANKDRGQINKNVHSLVSTTSDDEISNIIDLSREHTVGANKVTIRYQTVDVHGEAGKLARDSFWLPEDNYAIGAVVLKEPINPNSDFAVTVTNGKLPPFARLSGSFSSGNNIIKYNGTEVRLKKATPAQTRIIKSEEDRLRAVLDNNGQEVIFTGRLRLVPGQKKIIAKLKASQLNGFKVKNVFLGKPWKNSNGIKNATYSVKKDSMVLTSKGKTSNKLVIAAKQYPVPFPSVIAKFAPTSGAKMTKQGAKNSMFGITLGNRDVAGVHRCYLVAVFLGDRVGQPGYQAGLAVYRIGKGGRITAIPRIPTGNMQDLPISLPIQGGEWHWLQATHIAGHISTGGLDVFLDGAFVGRWKDNVAGNGGPNTWANTSGGVFVKDGSMLVDKVIALGFESGANSASFPTWDYLNKLATAGTVNFFTKQALKKKQKLPGRYKKHLKWTEIDKVYDTYLSFFKKRRRGRIFVEEFSNKLKEYIDEDIRFENGPALAAEVVNINPNVSVDRFITSPFGANINIRNSSSEIQFLSGRQLVDGSVEDVDAEQYIAVVGNGLVKAEAERTVSIKDLVGRNGEKKLEVDAEWIQHHDQADQLAEWIIENQGDGAEVYSITCSPNPLIEVGDHIDIDYSERGLLPEKQRFAVVSTSRGGAELIVRRIYPKATDVRKPFLEWE